MNKGHSCEHSNVAFPSTQEGRRTFPLWAAGKSHVPGRRNAGRSPCRAIVCFANADERCSSLRRVVGSGVAHWMLAAAGRGCVSADEQCSSLHSSRDAA
ncbi:MAG: hypothetical protein IKS21_04500 [Oscillospiraceae bacterium]|nr:hypothetical protein [Oscillospiraceae bacterium]